MEKSSKILIISLILVLSGSIYVWAEEVEGLIEFQAGKPAVASEVNDNFNAVKTAVDDNDAAITANSSSIVTNAGNISSNADKLTSRTGSQQTSWPSPNRYITSTTPTEITAIKITDSGTFDVSLSAHIVVEVTGPTLRYEFTIRRDSASGVVVGSGWWRPGAEGMQAVTIAFNGFDSSVAGPVYYYLCAAKFDINASDALIGFHGLNAEWSQSSSSRIKSPVLILE